MELVALDGVPYETRAGEIFGLLAPNGAGKSTTSPLAPGPPPGRAVIGEHDAWWEQ